MEELKIPSRLKNNIQVFIQELKDIYQQDLISVILYGSAASGDFVPAHSDINVLVVLKDIGIPDLKKAASFINKFKFRSLEPLFLSEDYIASSLDTFPIEFLDLKENHLLLYGKDVLTGIEVRLDNLRFQCEQELKVKLIRLNKAYLRIYRDKTFLRNVLFKTFSSVLHISRNLSRLRNKNVSYQRQEIIGELVRDFGINLKVWLDILAARKKEKVLRGEDIERLFIEFARDLKKLTECVDKL